MTLSTNLSERESTCIVPPDRSSKMSDLVISDTRFKVSSPKAHRVLGRYLNLDAPFPRPMGLSSMITIPE